MKNKWFIRFLFKSIARRKGRLTIAAVSVALAVAVITGMVGITAGINEKLGSELKSYGANIIVSPSVNNYLDYNVPGIVLEIPGVSSAEGQVFGSALTAGRSVEIIGLDVDKLKESGWKLYGNWPEQKNEILAGINLKEALSIEKGGTISLGKERMFQAGAESASYLSYRVSGFVERGGPEDNAVIMHIPDAWELTAINNKVSAVLVRGEAEKLDEIGEAIRMALPETSVKTIRQVAYAEKSLLNKIQLLMLMVTIVVLFAAVISVTSTMGANVLERREEIGLMKAIGATNREVGLFYTAEALLTGVIGGLAGYILGYLSAQAISKGAFHSTIQLPYYLLFISFALGIILSVTASHFPVRDALSRTPAVILRGE
jgi:putative ABC transport system permease protein